jgi:ABC-type polysaccharide/polyol phosphate export permease
MTSIVQLLRNIVSHRAMIWALALRDLESRYAGTLGGVLWAFAHPVAVVVIFYFVFAVGFRAQGPVNTPFILWFVCGLVPWFFFNETLLAITNSITSNAHLVKKTVFPTETLPFVHLVSGLFPHAIFLLILAGLLVFYGIPFRAERFAVIYFLACSCVLLLGLGWLLAALQVFYRDIGQGLAIILNLWFWVTPIVWSPDIMPSEYRSLLIYNPVYYLVEGFRGVLIFGTIVWPSVAATAYFWSVTTLCFLAGSYTFRRLKPEFPDVM